MITQLRAKPMVVRTPITQMVEIGTMKRTTMSLHTAQTNTSMAKNRVTTTESLRTMTMLMFTLKKQIP